MQAAEDAFGHILNTASAIVWDHPEATDYWEHLAARAISGRKAVRRDVFESDNEHFAIELEGAPAPRRVKGADGAEPPPAAVQSPKLAAALDAGGALGEVNAAKLKFDNGAPGALATEVPSPIVPVPPSQEAAVASPAAGSVEAPPAPAPALVPAGPSSIGQRTRSATRARAAAQMMAAAAPGSPSTQLAGALGAMRFLDPELEASQSKS